MEYMALWKRLHIHYCYGHTTTSRKGGVANDPVGSARIGNHTGIERQEGVAGGGLSIERIQT
jgi:hypothetical protein